MDELKPHYLIHSLMEFYLYLTAVFSGYSKVAGKILKSTFLIFITLLLPLQLLFSNFTASSFIFVSFCSTLIITWIHIILDNSFYYQVLIEVCKFLIIFIFIILSMFVCTMYFCRIYKKEVILTFVLTLSLSSVKLHFELFQLSNISLNKQFWFFGSYLPEKRYIRSKPEKWPSPSNCILLSLCNFRLSREFWFLKHIRTSLRGCLHEKNISHTARSTGCLVCRDDFIFLYMNMSGMNMSCDISLILERKRKLTWWLLEMLFSWYLSTLHCYFH